MRKLWDYNHPYYMAEGNYYKGGEVEYYENWEDFIENWGGEDVDLNRIHRWDFSEEKDQINLYYVMQRKARLMSVHVKIQESDHDRIKYFLKPHAELNARLWRGVLR